MKTLLVKGIGLVFVLYIFIYIVASFDNKTSSHDGSVVRERTAPSFDSLDYLIIGPSYVYVGINPVYIDSLGLKSYNDGVATAGPYFYELIIDDYLRSVKQKPRNILLNISLLTFCNKSDNWSSYPIHRYLNKPLSNEQLLIQNYAGVADYFRSVRKSFKKGFLYLTKQQLEEVEKVKQKQAEMKKNKGFSGGTTKTYSNIILNRSIDSYLPFKTCEFNYDKSNFLLQLINKYEKLGMHVILNEIPTFKLQEFFTNSYKKKYAEFVNSLMQQKIPLIQNTLTLDSTCFSNPDHMNKKGSDIYSKFLIRKIKNE